MQKLTTSVSVIVRPRERARCPIASSSKGRFIMAVSLGDLVGVGCGLCWPMFARANSRVCMLDRLFHFVKASFITILIFLACPGGCPRRFLEYQGISLCSMGWDGRRDTPMRPRIPG